MRIFIGIVAVLFACAVYADELTRTVQEQLKAQGAYSGPIDGKPSAELTTALKDYQQRHNLPASGALDQATAKALDDESGLALVSATPVPEKSPNSPIPQATVTSTPIPTPTESPASPSPTPTASPSASPLTSPIAVSPLPPEEAPTEFAVEQATKFIRDFLQASEGKYVTPQLRFYLFPVDYFEHGKVSQQFVRSDILRYMRQWPLRNYKLTGPLKITPIDLEKASAEFVISYGLQRGKRRVNGQINIRVTLKEIDDKLKITSIKGRRPPD